MRAPSRLLIVVAALAFGPVAPLAGQELATARIVVSAQFSSRTSLTVSSRILHFDVADPAQPAVAAVEFEAAARTATGGDVVLSVEPTRAIVGPGGAADVETAVTFEGDGEGTVAGALDPAAASVAGRWQGSGRRSGRLIFSLRAAAPGNYTLPVRFVLSTP